MMELTGIQKHLFELQDTKYGDFQAGLLPTVPRETVIGVRTPELRKFAKELFRTLTAQELEAFFRELPHIYFEENNLHGFLIEQIKDYESVIVELDHFLPYVDNWATCDQMMPKVLKKHTGELIFKIREWMASERPYTVRFGIGVLMRFYLDVEFLPEYLAEVAAVQSEEYYVNMMIAWYFATALAKQYEAALPYLVEGRLPVWTHNKTIQKAVESFRLTEEQKIYLRTLRR